MAKSAADRQRDYRRRRMQSDTVGYLESERRRKREFRQKRTRKQVFKETKKCRVRVQRHRQKKKTEAMRKKRPFKSPQSFGKAIAKAKRALPRSPNKRREVVKQIVESSGGNLVATATTSEEVPLEHNTTNNTVREFYSDDDISRQAPEKKDFVTIRTGSGLKKRLQKRHMLMTIMEAYYVFKEQHPELSIKKSKFFRLRPKNIIVNQLVPHNVCLCKYHENYRMLQRAISCACSAVPKTVDQLVAEIVCDRQNEDCMYGKCTYCPGLTLLRNRITDDDFSVVISWSQWKTEQKRIVKVTKTGTLSEALDDLTHQTPYFLWHSFIQVAQSAEFKRLCVIDDPSMAVLQVDFSENYLAQYQDEIQSAHWQNQQITIFTAVVWTNHSPPKSYAIVSDYLEHNRYDVNCFLKYLVGDISTGNPNISNIEIFSDGAASQFKQRYNLANIVRLERQYGLSITWNFFATSHGKGAVDGIGGTVKRTVWRKVRSTGTIVRDATSFAEVAQTESTSIHVIFIPEQEILSDKISFDCHCNGICAIPSTQRMHCFNPINQNQISCKFYSSSSESRICNIRPLPEASSDNNCDLAESAEATSSNNINVCITCGVNFYDEDQTVDWIACQECGHYSHGTENCLLGSLDDYYTCHLLFVKIIM